MDAEDYRRKAQQFLDMARQMTSPEDKAALTELATFWMERAEEADRTSALSENRTIGNQNNS